MTPALNDNPVISTVTLAAMGDIGYEVNLGFADPEAPTLNTTTSSGDIQDGDNFSAAVAEENIIEREDIIDGNNSNNSLNGNEKDNIISGGRGKDTLSGLSGDDYIKGEDGTDELFGNKGNDILNGGAGSDLLFGAAGDDLLVGNRGDDSLTGGEGSDIFAVEFNKESNLITDFVDGVDYIGLNNGVGVSDLNIVQGDGTLIQDKQNSTLATLQGIDAATISGDDFISL